MVSGLVASLAAKLQPESQKLPWRFWASPVERVGGEITRYFVSQLRHRKRFPNRHPDKILNPRDQSAFDLHAAPVRASSSPSAMPPARPRCRAR
jgi:hypothetical protein